MGKKKKRSGGGGGCGGGGEGGGGQQPKPAEEAKDKAVEDEACDKYKEKEGEEKQGKEECVKEKKQDNKGKQLPVVTAVLKVDMHCDGCAKRIRASVRHYPGVEGVAMEVDKGTMTVVGRLDAKKLRDRVARKTKKNVDLVVSNNQHTNKGKDDDDDKKQQQQQQNQNFKVHEYGIYDLYWLDKVHGGYDAKALQDHAANKPNNKPCQGGGGGGGGGGNKGKQDHKDKQDDKGSGGGGGGDKAKGGKDNKKPVVPVVGTVVLKIGAMGLHCDGCMNRVRNKLFKIKGVEQVVMDMAKNQVTVTGTMDMKALPGKLQKKVRRPVDVVQPSNKDKDKDKEGNKQEGKDKDKDKALAAGMEMEMEMEMWKAAFYAQHSLLNTEFMLSDENPNACSVM